MKLTNKYILSIFSASSILFMSSIDAYAGFPLKGQDGNSIVQSPSVPASVTFAGNKIDLDRVDMYERLDRELTAMSYTHGNTLLLLKRANKYFPEIIPILKKQGVPEDIIYLACIESTLNPRAYSAAKAAGLWQFIPSTAKHYGLEVNEFVDERSCGARSHDSLRFIPCRRDIALYVSAFGYETHHGKSS